MVDAHLRSKTIETADIKNLIIGGQTGIDGIRFCLAAVTNGENLANPAFSWFLQYKNKNGQGESVGLTPVYENGLVKLPWVPNKLATQVPGRMQIQLYAAIITGEGEAAVVDKQWVSEFAIIYIQENINPDPIIATEPSIIEYYVTLYAAYKNSAEAAAAAALESEQAAALSKSNAAESEAAALASKQAAGLSEQAAALAAGSALGSKNSIDATFTDPGLVAVRTDMATPETSKIQKVAANEANITEVADDLNLGSSSKIKKVADDITKVGAVADGMTHVTAVEAKLTDIAKVAAIEVAVPKVAAIDTDVTKVAAIDEAVGLVAGVKDDVTAVALIDDEISAIALIKDQIVSLDAEKLKVSAVEAKLAEIQGVYAKLQAIEGLYGKSTKIDALYAQLDLIAEKANAKDMVELRADYDLTKKQTDERVTAIAGSVLSADEIHNLGSPNVLGTGLASNWDTPVAVAAQDGDMSLELQGKLGANLIVNGDFSQGITGWLPRENTEISGNGGTITALATADSTSVGITQTVRNTAASVIFYMIRIKSDVSAPIYLQSSVIVGNTVAGQWTTLSIVAVPPIPDTTFRIYQSLLNGQKFEIDYIYCVDLTLLGLATLLNTTVKARAYFANHHPAVLGVGEQRVRTVGNNLLNAAAYAQSFMGAIMLRGILAIDNDALVITSTSNDCYTNNYIGVGSVLPSDRRNGVINVAHLQGKTIYHRRKIEGLTTSSNEFYSFYDGSFICLELTSIGTLAGVRETAIAVPQEAKYMTVRYGITSGLQTVRYSEFTISLQPTASHPYEPYKAVSSWTPHIGYRLPNGVADSFNVRMGMHAKRVSDVKSITSVGWDKVWTSATQDVYRKTLLSLGITNAGNWVPTAKSGIIYSSLKGIVPWGMSWGSTQFGWAQYLDSATLCIDLTVPIGSTIASYWGELTFIYQLATPILTQHSPQYLQAFKGGSFYLDAGKRDGMVYDATGMEFSYDVLSVEKLYKFQAGEKVEITDSVINGKFVTSPSLSIGDICYIEVLYKSDQSLAPVSVSKVPYANLSTLMTVLKGGAIGQVLRKKSNTDWDFEWVTL